MDANDLVSRLRPLGFGDDDVKYGVRADFRCEYCKRDLLASVDDYADWTRDHIDPDGGNELWNLALACRQCNMFKARSTEHLGDEPENEAGRRLRIERAAAMIERVRLEKKTPRLMQVREVLRAAGKIDEERFATG